ncbi:MAG: AbrB family transcriptional regulator [Parvibaculaceae bacterium]
MTLALGAAGGGAFAVIHFPAPWLAGSMIAAIVAVLCGLKLWVPNALRSAAFIILGVQIGSSVTMETLNTVARWPLSLVMLMVTVAAVTAACYLFYRRMRAWPVADALFSSLPGALGLVVALADEAKADMRRVIIAQSIRLFFLVAALPLIINSLSTHQPPGTVAANPVWWEITLVVAASAAVALLCERLRVPAGLFVGAIVTSALFYVGGIAHGALPAPILILANVVLGTSLAARFQDFTMGELLHALGDGVAGFAIALVISVLGAVLTSLIAGLPFAQTLLAFAPGGLDVMTVIALALNLDPAYVGAHQLARYLAMSLVIPPLTAYLLRRRLPPPGNAPDAD